MPVRVMLSPNTFDRTYEGLKLPEPWKEEREKAAFDRTYEGLKRRPRELGGPHHEAF